MKSPPRLREVAPPRLPPAEAPEFMWCFDRGFEALVFIDAKRALVQVTPRKVWEEMTHEGRPQFTFNELRFLPPVPQPIHDSLVREMQGDSRIIR